MKRLLLILLFVYSNTWATGLAGLNYTTYAAGGATPSYTQNVDGTLNKTVLSSGTVSSINYNWGGGNVLTSGRGDGVIIRFYGYINIATSGTYYFGGNADDGIRIKVDGTSVVNSWIEDGGSFRSGSIYLAAGVYPIELIYYENGGGALVNLQWYLNNTWQVISSTSLATDSTYWAPSLCCGGSSASFNANPTNVNKVNAFINRNTADSKVYVEQIGDNNIITVKQSGTKNNDTNYVGNGSYNNISITQSGNNSTQANYIDLSVHGSSNTINLTQSSTGGGKGIFATVNDNNNSVTVLQKDGGSDYLNLNLSGGGKTIDITQQGSAGHMADITLSGAGTRSLNLTQQGSTQQFYSINSSCTANCQPITVIQGN